MRPAELIRYQTKDIADEWASCARDEVASDGALSTPDLYDHFPALLTELAASLDRETTGEDAYCKEAQHHAQHRLEHRFKLREVVFEYRILRRVLFRRVRSAGAGADVLDELARLNEGLDLAVAEAVDRFSSLRERQQRAEHDDAAAFRERFIGIVSHDLRTPVSAISMAAQRMLRSGEIPPTLRELASRVLTNTERMTRLIGDLLDFTRGRLGGGIPIAPRPTHLESVLRAVVDTMLATHPDRAVVSECHGELEGTWDPDRLGQVVSNLLGNAIDHGDPDAPVRVTLEGAGDEVTLEVHNAGRPIPAEEIARVFEPFHSARSRSTTGLGLGLFIAHDIVRAHGGEMAVTSTDGERTTFRVTLPRATSPALAPSAHAPEE